MRTTVLVLLLSLALVVPTSAAQQPQPPVPGQPMPPMPGRLAVTDADVEALLAKAMEPNKTIATEAAAALAALGPDAVPVLTQGLWAESASVRRTCAQVLGEIGADSKPAVSSLVRALSDDSKDVRREAARALGAIQAHSAIPALTKLLKDKAVGTQVAAAHALVALGADAEPLVPVLTKALKADAAEDQYYAAWVLGELGPEAAPGLLAIQDAFVEAEPLLAARLADTLGRIGAEAKAAAPALKKKLENPAAEAFRVQAAIAMWRISRDRDSAGFLREAVAAKKTRVLPHGALWRIEPAPETVTALEKQLRSGDMAEVLLAADVLGARSKDTAPQLTKFLAQVAKLITDPANPPAGLDPEEALRQAPQAMAILSRIGPGAKEALEPLTTLAKGKNPLSFPAAVTIAQIDSKADNMMAVAGYLEDKDLRVQAAEALKQLRPTGKAIAIELGVALNDPDEELKLSAALALWRIEKNASALKVMSKLLRSTDSKIRERAALELGGEFGADAKAAVPDLVKRLFDVRSSVRSTAAEALGRIGPGARDATGPLLAVLDGDEPPFVQSAAIEALGRIEPNEKEAVVAVLKQKLEHPAPLVRAHAALALVVVADDKAGQNEAVRGLTSRSHYVRITAAEALWKINKDGRAVALLVRALEESNLSGTESENERYMAARALGRIGADAKVAVPELLKLIDARDEAVASAARTALKAIDPEAAKKAGVK